MGALIVLFILGMLFVLLVFPLWMIIHCVMAEDRKLVFKVLWIIFIFFSWVLGSLIYGLFASRKALIQWIAGSILVVGFLSIFFIVNTLYQVARSVSLESVQKVSTLVSQDLSLEHVKKLKGCLMTLRQELNDAKGLKSVYLIQETYKDMMLNQVFVVMMDDGQMSISEYNAWIEKFDNRRRLDARVLSAYLKSLGQAKKE